MGLFKKRYRAVPTTKSPMTWMVMDEKTSQYVQGTENKDFGPVDAEAERLNKGK